MKIRNLLKAKDLIPLIPSLICFMFFLSGGAIWFYMGRTFFQKRQFSEIFMVMLIFIAMIMGAVLLAAIVQLVRVIICLCKANYKLLLKSLVLLILIFGIVLLSIVFSSAQDDKFLKGFKESLLEEKIDTAAIQKWLDTLEVEDEERFYGDEPEVPEEIAKLSPHFIYIRKTPKGENYANIVFYEAHLYFGIAVGVAYDEVPKSDSLRHESKLPFEVNAFVWR